MDKARNSKKPEPLDRVPLNKNCASKIDRHISQIKEHQPGAKISRKIYIEHLVSKLSDELSDTETKKMATLFFDEEKFLRSLMNQVKQSKKTGGHFDINDYIKTNPKKEKVPRAKKTASDSKKSAENAKKPSVDSEELTAQTDGKYRGTTV